jgi:hypothetical protein
MWARVSETEPNANALRTQPGSRRVLPRHLACAPAFDPGPPPKSMR